MPAHPRSYSPVAAEKLRRALLALAAAATATVAGTGCTISGARVQKPSETVPPPTVEGGSGDSIRCGQQLYVPESEPTPPSQTSAVEPRLGGVPLPPPRTPAVEPRVPGGIPIPPRADGSASKESSSGDSRSLPPKDGYAVYVVKPGDTLSAIAQRHEVLQKSIIEANGLADPNRIRASPTVRSSSSSATPGSAPSSSSPASPPPSRGALTRKKLTQRAQSQNLTRSSRSPRSRFAIWLCGQL